MRFTLAPLGSFDIGAAIAATIALIAYRAGTLDAGGALAAILVGTATFGALGPPGAAVLLTFFVSSVVLSRLGRARKRTRLGDTAKTGPRDAAQVFANGAVSALCALAAMWLAPRYTVAFAGAFAAATADTWGTEIGTLFARKPRSLLTGRPTTAGLSGGVTWPGTFAEIAGALVLAFVFALAFDRHAFGAVALAGIAGAFVDSLLGASVQALRYCANCKRATEREPHDCGANTRLVRGLGWFGNDLVNLGATVTGAVVAYWLVLRS